MQGESTRLAGFVVVQQDAQFAARPNPESEIQLAIVHSPIGAGSFEFSASMPFTCPVAIDKREDEYRSDEYGNARTENQPLTRS